MSTPIVSSISGLEIYAPSAGHAPTNSGDVSAIASSYQVVSSTATQLYAGTAYLTSVNGAPISASRAGNAANASMANSAYYDGTGRLISALPDSATVSAIASSYAESAASAKADSSALSSYALSSDVSGVIDTVSANSASWGQGGVTSVESGTSHTGTATAVVTGITGINGSGIVPPKAATAYFWSPKFNKYISGYRKLWNIELIAASSEMAGRDGTGRLISALPDSATVSAIASSYTESAVSSKADASALSSYALSSDVSGVIDTVSANSASWGQGGVDSATVSAIASAYQVVSSVGDDGTYITSINGLGLSGQGGGGGGVVTATGSASATEGWWPLTTSYLVSSINGSALLPFGFSSVSANSSNWNSTRTTVLNNSANWTSVYDTVYSNSASWTGSTGGGSVTSPSGTILVMNGNEIEGTNSAALTASSEEFEEVLRAYNQFFATSMQLLTNDAVPDTGATLMVQLGYSVYGDTRVILSGRDTGYGYTSASGIIPTGVLTASIPMDGITGDISASAEQWVSLANGQLTAKKEGGITVTGIGELAWKSAVDNVTNTVSANSATWGQGGVDSATVSAIASAYQVVSSLGYKPYEDDEENFLTAVVAINGNMISAASALWAHKASSANRAGTAEVAFWDEDGRDISSLPGSAEVSAIASSYAESAVSSKLDSSASSSFYTTANESGYVGSAYVDSAVSGKMDSSAIDYTRTGGGTQIYASGTGSSTNQFSAKNDSAGAAIIAGENARLRLWDTAATGNIYASSISTWNNKMDGSAVQTAYASASASQATANGVLYILIPDGA